MDVQTKSRLKGWPTKTAIGVAMLLGVLAVYAFAAYTMVSGADVSGAHLTAKVTVTDTTNTARTNVIATVPLGTQGLIDSGISNASSSNIVLCEEGTTCPAGNEIPFMPSPLKSPMKGAVRRFAVDFTADANDAGANDVTLFQSPVTANNEFHFIADTPFRVLTINVGTAGVISTTTLSLAWEYYNGTAWLAVPNLSDSTANFTKTGIRTVTWDMPVDMGIKSTSGIHGYTVRARATVGATFTTAPLATQIWYSPGVFWMFNDSLAANQAVDYTLFAGGPTEMATSHQMFVGRTGMSTSTGIVTPDNGTLEPSTNSYIVEIGGYFLADGALGDTHIFSKNGSNWGALWDDHFIDFQAGGDVVAQINHSIDDCNLTGSGLATEGIHTIAVESDGAGTCVLVVDGVQVDSDTASSNVPNNTGDWHWGGNGNALYLTHVSLTVAGTLVLDYNGQPTSSTVVMDQAGDDHNGVVGFAKISDTTTGVIASFVTTDPPTEQEAGAVTGDAVGIVAPTAAFASSSAPVSGLPGSVFIAGIATDTNLPQAFFWLMIAGFLSIVTFIGVQLAMRNLLWSVVAGGIVLTAFAAPTVGVTAVWVLMFYGIMSGVVLIVGDRIQASSA